MKGFTLIEMMVALFIFALLSAAGVAVLAGTAENRVAVRDRLDRLGEFERARGLMRADLAQVANRRTRGVDGTTARGAFTGADRQLLMAFVRRGWINPDVEARASLQYVEYRVVDDRLERRTRAGLDGETNRTPQVLLTGVESAELEYLYRGQWAPGWGGGPTELPEAVRLSLVLDDYGPVTQAFLVSGEGQ